MNSIFAEPPENVDETFTHGAMLGGMVGYSEETIADSYFRAGELLTANVLKGDLDARDILNPVLFCYRHGVELYLKAIVHPKSRNHDLHKLLELFRAHCLDRHGASLPAWFDQPIMELSDFDRGSTTFRYETQVRGGEYWVDLRSLRLTMEQLRLALRRVLRTDHLGEMPPPEWPRIERPEPGEL